MSDLLYDRCGVVKPIAGMDQAMEWIRILQNKLSAQSEDIQRNYPTPLQWAQAQNRIADLEAYLRNLLADIDHGWATRAIPGLRYIEYQFSRGDTEEIRKLLGGKP